MTQRDYLEWLSHAHAMLVEACGSQLGDVRVLVYYEVSKHGVEFRLPTAAPAETGEEWPAEAVSLTAEQSDELFPLRTVHRRLLEVMSAEPKPAKRIAREAGYRRANSYVRNALTELVRWGHVQHTPDGYRQAGRGED